MKRTLGVLLLLVSTVALARPPARPRPPPPLPPPVEEVIEDDPAVDDAQVDPTPLPEADPDADDDLPPVAKSTRGNRTHNDLTDEQAGAVAVASMCCCLVALVGLIALIVWLVKRGSGGPKPLQNHPPQPAPSTVGGTMQLSIFALALEPIARDALEQQLELLGISSVPTTRTPLRANGPASTG